MPDKTLTTMKIAILATHGFELSELVEPRKALDEAGARTFLIAPHAGRITAVKHDERAGSVPVDMTLDEADPDTFDAVLLPGGALNADQLRVNPRAQQFVRALEAQGKPLAVICHGPWLLVSAGLVKGRTLTSYHTIQDDLRNAGARWEDREVVRDRNWISSRQPSDIPSFNRAMMGIFAEYHGGGPVAER